MDAKRMIGIALLAGSLALAPHTTRADCGWCEGRRPYGDYCEGWGAGRYGAKDPVKTADEARKRLERYFEDEDVVVGKITEKDTYFEADIRTPEGELSDRVIVDKRTGRIRSVL